MKDDFPPLKKTLVPLLKEKSARFNTFTIGLTLYKDYMEPYVTKNIEFMTDWKKIQSIIDSLEATGGRDIPEAVWEAMDAAVTGYTWTANDRVVILIGDAPPHPIPRGNVTMESVREEARQRQVKIYSIILPQ